MSGFSLPVYGGFTIAGDFTNALADVNVTTGVIIENATGGSNNDDHWQRGQLNRLVGNGSTDNISGGAGDDWIDGGSGTGASFWAAWATTRSSMTSVTIGAAVRSMAATA
ncbi:MAG: hypothetical protein R3D29_06660 [Nitratireductor sp.]